MCGIVGYVGRRSITNVVMVGLERLEYRGYDSCGIAVVDGGLRIRKTAGRLQKLKDILAREPLEGNVGIGHTRWATHGQVTDENAHPFTDTNRAIALVHNGIIENYRELRARLKKQGCRFVSDTDTEVIVHLIASHLKRDLGAAIRRAVRELRGAFSLAVVSAAHPDRVWAVKMGSPLVIGRGRGEFVLASDAPALVGIARRMLALQDGDIAVLTREELTITDFDNRPVERPFVKLELKARAISKGRYPHFMRKEIFEQPRVIAGNIARRLGPEDGGKPARPRSSVNVTLDPEFLLYPDDIEQLERIVIQACGTSWHAGLVGRYWFEKLCRIPTAVEISSELRTADYLYDGNTMMLPVSQSGETADTLAALCEACGRDVKSLAVLNVRRSSIDREADSTVYIHAGPEIGVASTKAYTAQLFNLLAIALYFARIRGTMPDSSWREITGHIRELPKLMKRALALDRRILETARGLAGAHDFLFLGRGINYPTALEGALKLKEIAYVHATGYPAGEMKHGPISLVDENVPVICIAPRDSVYEKMISNMAEARARKGRIIAVGTRGDRNLAELAETVLYVPETPEYLSPLLTVLPLQLLAYHIAVLRGCDVDKPRNLAKSVTVE
ncbi:MAG TPA: glutamine--fructose-6-phosphate transaminase (isomerizing) [candidate division WOR-3 bacterium]|uniref:Glutamine--fructose-6-phosphate aminotransferase [isomerizing] n=1 Tax=candidate division WOR-3 bacterium TaxID=2052148 RepID=A0A7V0XEZ3_UNCW3|nr:glutamine--fructose-6-phosphate transaminase (isomerizing) [candidate division WOR-3 bacterium]